MREQFIAQWTAPSLAMLNDGFPRDQYLDFGDEIWSLDDVHLCFEKQLIRKIRPTLSCYVVYVQC